MQRGFGDNSCTSFSPMNIHSLLARLKGAFPPATAVAALLILSFVTPANAAAGGRPAQLDHNPTFSSIVVLGDSLSDTGRTSAVLTQLLGTPFPPPPYAPGRMSNGPLWIEHFAPMVRQTYQPLDNYSWAGANTGHTNVFAIGLPGMLHELGELLTPPRRLDQNALYIVFGGSNDFLRIFGGDDPNVVITSGVSNLLTIVVTLRSAGAQNIIVVDLPDIGRTPRAMAMGPANSATATFLSATFNLQLNNALNRLPFPIVRVSLFNLLSDFIARPNKYGFTNVTAEGRYDAANSDGYLFWDDVHPTTRAHRFLASEVFHALASASMLGQQKN
jgi:phospholipase/lecithinase/hemolysin